MTCPCNSKNYWENTCSVKSPWLGKNRLWGNTISKSQACLKWGMTPASSPGFKERAADGKEKSRGACSCSDTFRTSVACWHCPVPWPVQLCCFQLSQAHRDNTPPLLDKVTPTKLMWFANPTVQSTNFNKPVQGALINTLGIVSNPGLG